MREARAAGGHAAAAPPRSLMKSQALSLKNLPSGPVLGGLAFSGQPINPEILEAAVAYCASPDAGGVERETLKGLVQLIVALQQNHALSA